MNKTTKKHKWNNTDLLDSFNELNRKYFGNKLKTPDRLAFVPLDGLGHTFRYRKGKRRRKNDTFGIHISTRTRFSKRLWYISLAHEMIHLEQGLKYTCGPRGIKFNNRTIDLVIDGAFKGVL